MIAMARSIGLSRCMRQARMKVPESYPVGYYHCISRIVDRQFLFGDTEREQFVDFMREYEAFCGVRILTYCIMSNHFHILVEVPKRPEVLPSPEVLVRQLGQLSGHVNVGTVIQRIEMLRNSKADKELEEYLESFWARMWDVSAFMKLLKQRYTQWYNSQKGRKGTLWEERFKSVLVDGCGEVLGTMAAYIDLNPVRAGILEDPADYRWSGYGEASAGSRRAMEGLRRVVAAVERLDPAAGQGAKSREADEVLSRYRLFVYGAGEEREGITPEGVPMRRGFDREAVLKVVAEKGRLGMEDFLRLRVRYFSDGAILGTRGFLESMFGAMKERFGAKRKDGARRVRGLKGELYALRDLKKAVFG